MCKVRKIKCPECEHEMELFSWDCQEAGYVICEECGRDFWSDPEENQPFPSWDYHGN